ncbi:MAG: TetR/AcrR family transcriptional regulator [Alphaproteobacteria bacterium]
MSTTTTKGSDTRERILDAAQALILARGFAGTSLDDILKATKLTKGAFFHHFRSKADLGSVLVHRFAERDMAAFEEWSRRADALADDPLQAAMVFLKLFEEELKGLPEPFPGCMLASYVYEREQFDADVLEYVAEVFRKWSNYFEARFEQVMKTRKPKVAVSARELAEMIVSILEGAFILSRAYNEPKLIVRQSELFRQHLQLLFAENASPQSSPKLPA